MSEIIKIVTDEELSLVENNALGQQQLAHLLKTTPAKNVKKRPAKGGGTWDYVTGGYVRKCLNLMFGWDWSFEIIEQMVMHGEAIVKGKLTCNSNGKTIVKMQFGNKDIVYKKQTDEEKAKGVEKVPLSIGNDFKAACTDCLKKCSAEIGIAADIYNKEDFTPIEVVSTQDIFDDLLYWFNLKKENLPLDILSNTERIIETKEVKSYQKALNTLKTL